MHPCNHERGRPRLLVYALILLAGCASAPRARTTAPAERAALPGIAAPPASPDPADAGIEVVWVRRTAHGHMLDFRYRVTDSERAKELLKRGTVAYLVHEPSGAKLGVPNMPKVGTLRQSTMEPEKGRVYFMIFSANGLAVNHGDRVDVVFGKYRFDNLTVQ